MSAASSRRWKRAQDAELRFRSLFEDRKLPTRSSFFSTKFPVEPELFAGKRVLEIGCSPSAEIHLLARAGLRVGIDPLASEWAQLYLGGTHHVQGAGERLPFKAGAFEVILCLNVIDHVHDPAAILTEARRVLKAGGHLALFSNTFSAPRMVRRWLGLLDPPHPHHFSDAELLGLVQRVGFRVLQHGHQRVPLGAPASFLRTRWPSLMIAGVKQLAGVFLLGLQESSYLCAAAEA